MKLFNPQNIASFGMALISIGVLPANLHAADEIFLADPTIFTDNGKYYMSGTRFVDPQGFPLLESEDMVHWTYSRPDMMILRKGGQSYGSTGFWAPQIFKDKDGYLLAYTANEQTVVASSPTIDGIYTQDAASPVDGSQKNIDPFIFRDDDGRYYFYHVRFGGGNYLWGAEFNPETGKIVDGTLSKCFANTQPWEHTGSYPSDPIMEGPTVIKLDGMYYLFYSANHFQSIDYAVGYAYSESPLGPWIKNENNPMISRSIVGEKGSGHGDIFFDNDGNMRYVYHVHCNDNQANPRRTRIVKLNVDKSGGHPYKITADNSSIITPVLENDGLNPENVTSLNIIGSVVKSEAKLTQAGKGVWKGTVNLDASTTAEYLNRTISFLLNGDDALVLKRVPGTDRLRLCSDSYNSGEGIRINPGTYTFTVDLNTMSYSIEAETDPNRISVFGSSVANGQGATNRHGYAYLYGQLLSSRYSKGTSGNPFTISGVSIGGNTTTDLLNRYDDLLRDFGKYVIIGLSMGNEGIHGATNQEAVFNKFRDNMLAIIGKIRADGKIPVVMNNYTRADYDASDYNYIRRMNMLIHEWDVPSCNTLGAIDDGSGHWAEGFIADNAHPDSKGHAEFFYSMVPSLFDALAKEKPMPTRDSSGSLTLSGGATVTFTPEERAHSFTIAMRVRGNGRGLLLSFEHGNRRNYTGRLIVNENGTITYDSPQEEDFTTRRTLLNDEEWHDITLTHFYARGETLLYFDNTFAGSTRESLLPWTFTLGNPEATSTGSFALSELSFWRSGMNATEIKARNEGAMLKSSLEIYSPMTFDIPAGASATSIEIPNLAQSLNAAAYKHPGHAGIESPLIADKTAPLCYYTVDGIAVNPAKARGGRIYIARYANGSVRKIVLP